MPFLTDGFKSLIRFLDAPANAMNTGIIKEKEVQAPDLDGGGDLDTTTMRNFRVRTKQPKRLITMGMMKCKVQYDPIIYFSVISFVLNRNGRIAVMFPDTSTLIFFGWVNKLTPDSYKEGDFALCDMEIICSNQSLDGTEQAPLYRPPGIQELAGFPALAALYPSGVGPNGGI